MSQSSHRSPSFRSSFQTTHWSVVRHALDATHPESHQALTQLCEIYWHPVYVFIRRAGSTPHDAEDFTQGFFARLIEGKFLAVADKDKGKLRTFLLTCVKRYLSDEADKAGALKRGANVIVPINSAWAEKRFLAEAADHLSPDRHYQRRWALTLLDSTSEQLQDQYLAENKAALFQVIKPFLSFSEDRKGSYKDAASRLNISENTFKSHVHRLRERWRELLMAQVAATLDDPTSDNIKAELAELIGWV